VFWFSQVINSTLKLRKKFWRY